MRLAGLFVADTHIKTTNSRITFALKGVTVDITAKKIVVDNQEYDLPTGIEPLGEDGLFLVDWNLIEIAKELTSDEKFRFFNPRHLGQYEIDNNKKVESFLGQGFDKETMTILMADIVANGMEYPFIAYFIIEKGQIKVRINDGERRWRCLDRIIEKNEKVWCRQHEQFLPAKEVYAKVICRVKCMTEEEAMKRACMVSETAVKWGDGALARLVQAFYKKGKTDEEICAILSKSKNWLAETASLNDLDEYCFSFLLSNKINRKVALDLVKIKDVKTRQTWLSEAWKNALEEHAKLQIKNEKLLENAETNQDVKDSEVEEAKTKGSSTTVIAEKETEAVEAGEKTKRRKEAKAASAKPPIIKSKNLRRAAGGLLDSALRPLKIKKKLEAVEAMIEKKDTSLVDMKVLLTLKHAYKCILEGEEDIMVVLDILKKL